MKSPIRIEPSDSGTCPVTHTASASVIAPSISNIIASGPSAPRASSIASHGSPQSPPVARALADATIRAVNGSRY